MEENEPKKNRRKNRPKRQADLSVKMAAAPRRRRAEELQSTHEIENTVHKPIIITIIIKHSRTY